MATPMLTVITARHGFDRPRYGDIVSHTSFTSGSSHWDMAGSRQVPQVEGQAPHVQLISLEHPGCLRQLYAKFVMQVLFSRWNPGMQAPPSGPVVMAAFRWATHTEEGGQVRSPHSSSVPWPMPPVEVPPAPPVAELPPLVPAPPVPAPLVPPSVDEPASPDALPEPPFVAPP